MIDLDRVRDVERQLSTHPRFGDASVLRRDVGVFRDLGLRMAAGADAAARRLAEACARASAHDTAETLADPVVRDAIAQLSACGPAPSAATVCDAAAKQLADPVDSGADRTLEIVSNSVRIWWPDDQGPLADRFRELFDHSVAQHLAVGGTTLRKPTGGELAQLREAAHRLADTVPALAGSVLAHVRAIAVVEAAGGPATPIVESASSMRFPATVFLSELAFSNPVQTAESLLHEAAHHKLYDTRRCRSVLAPDYSDEAAVLIRAGWNRDSNLDHATWPSARAVSACYVYVHLAALHAVFAGTAETMLSGARARTCTQRARYLADQARARALVDHGEDGVALLEWLAGCIEQLERALADKTDSD